MPSCRQTGHGRLQDALQQYVGDTALLYQTGSALTSRSPILCSNYYPTGPSIPPATVPTPLPRPGTPPFHPGARADLISDGKHSYRIGMAHPFCVFTWLVPAAMASRLACFSYHSQGASPCRAHICPVGISMDQAVDLL